MKQLRFTLFLMVFAIVLPNTPSLAIVHSASAATEVSTPAATAPTLTKKEQRKQEKLQKRLAKFKDGGIDLKDPVKKWLWYAIGFWILGIIFGPVLAGTLGFYYLAYLLWLAGSVCFVIWLLKFTGTMD